MENGRYIVFNFATNLLDADTLSQKLDTVFDKLKYAAKLNVSLGFSLKNIEDGTYRYYYTHENDTSMERSKFVETKEVLLKIKNVFSSTNVTGACTKERANTKWKLYKFTNFTVFADLPRKVPMGSKNAVPPEPLTKNNTVNCLTYEWNTRKPYNDNLCLHRALSLYFHGDVGLEGEMFTLLL